MILEKQRPGRYIVWVGDIWFAFRTERDAGRFMNAASYSVEDNRYERRAAQ